ncbi:proteasome subunit alpha type [Striga asiatica]|uniref:Proteasome subunit alpha type n=1 Tax=Striga asiatica TaxID=4170 RepID=A0A5A7PMQ4_STRAF|nr:proteasome subunit alpha type [Striga asiatica]
MVDQPRTFQRSSSPPLVKQHRADAQPYDGSRGLLAAVLIAGGRGWSRRLGSPEAAIHACTRVAGILREMEAALGSDSRRGRRAGRSVAGVSLPAGRLFQVEYAMEVVKQKSSRRWKKKLEIGDCGWGP